MTRLRRDFLRLLAAAGAAGASSSDAAVAPPAPVAAPADHDMSAIPASWHGKEQIAMLLYPGFTALDLVGPQYMFGNLLGATVHLVARTRAPVMSDTGMAIAPTTTMAACPKVLDVLFVPGGGEGTLNAMRDKALVAWIAERGARAKWLTSVCTGSMLLGQAGLLRGKRASSHWVTRDLLAEFGATPVDQRYVFDGNVVTGAGVSAGLDMGLAMLARLRDEEYAQSVQLLAEYAPQPPFQSGTPQSAPPKVREWVEGMFEGLRRSMRAAAASQTRQR